MHKNTEIALFFEKSEVTKISIGTMHNKGMRSYQEDSYGYTSAANSHGAKKRCFVAAVSDGMGGMCGGKEISSYAVSAMLEFDSRINTLRTMSECFRTAFNEINSEVLYRGIGGGATLCAVCCTKQGVFWGAIGDSRIYLFRSGRLYQLSRDTDYMDVLLDSVIKGDISFSDALCDPQKDSLAAYIGADAELLPDCNILPLSPHKSDGILICTDGVYNALSDAELVGMLSLSAQESVDAISEAIIGRLIPDQDNNTAIVLKFD